MRLFQGKLKPVGAMTDEELDAALSLLREIREKSVSDSSQSIKRRAGRAPAKPRTLNTIDIEKVAASLPPEMLEKFREALAKRARG